MNEASKTDPHPDPALARTGFTNRFLALISRCFWGYETASSLAGAEIKLLEKQHGFNGNTRRRVETTADKAGRKCVSEPMLSQLKKIGIAPKAIAGRIGVKESAVSHWYRDKEIPTWQNIRRIEERFQAELTNAGWKRPEQQTIDGVAWTAALNHVRNREMKCPATRSIEPVEFECVKQALASSEYRDAIGKPTPERDLLANNIIDHCSRRCECAPAGEGSAYLDALIVDFALAVALTRECLPVPVPVIERAQL